jgi:drug/metabolite transporter (DMT)-like permease
MRPNFVLIRCGRGKWACRVRFLLDLGGGLHREHRRLLLRLLVLSRSCPFISMKDATDFFLAFGMLATGSLNTIVTKLADGGCQRNHDNQPLLYDPAHIINPPFWGPAHSTPGGSENGDAIYTKGHELEPYQCVQFNHPFVQAAFMFIGEILCGVVYIGLRCSGRGEPMPYFNPLYLAVAGMCDMTATSMMYVGLTMTYASTFQILRGFVVVVTAVFSQFVLKRKQQIYQWFGVGMVVVGTIVVGAAPYVPPPMGTKGGAADTGATNAPLGNAIIILAQIVVGCQMCWEEKYVTEYNIPALLVVGWEGFFGLFAIHLLITVVHQISDFSVGSEIAVFKANKTDTPPAVYTPPAAVDSEHGWGGGNADTVFWFGEDDAFLQFKAGSPNNPTLIIAMFCMVCSIAFFNFFGISVTKKMSASHRMVLDSVRTCVVWTVGLLAFGEKFSILQLIGFIILITGSE